jgi:hypothetical protein
MGIFRVHKGANSPLLSIRDKLLDLDLDLCSTASVKPKLCMAAIAGLALVNRSAGTAAATPARCFRPAGVAAGQSPRTAVNERSIPTPQVKILLSS